MNMALREIGSHDEMLQLLDEKKKNYILLYKKGSETSECSYKNIEKVADKVKSINVAAADVTSVRDIHPKYSVTSAPTLLVFEGKNFIKTVKGCNDENYYKSLFESSFYTSSTDSEEQPQKRVTVYSTPTCTWCNALKTHLRKNGIRFRDVDVSKDQKAAEAMVKRSGQQGVPQTDINGEIIVGFDKNRINTLLGIH
jgi:glutaredoxin-like YruB-family protein